MTTYASKLNFGDKMMKQSGILLAGKKLLLLALLCASTMFAQTFTFTAIPDQDETKLKERFSLLANYLSKELKMDVKFVPVKSYSASIAAFRNNQVQLAWFGGLSGVKARLVVPGSVAIAQGVEDPNFHSFIIANSSTGLEKSDTIPAGIEGKIFTFGSKGSTSGRLMPEYFISKQFGKSPDELFKKVGFFLCLFIDFLLLCFFFYWSVFG